MSSLIRSARDFGKSVLHIVRSERLPLMAGGLAYFTVLAVVPVLIAFASIAGLFLSAQDVDRVISMTGTLIPSLDESTTTQLIALANETSRATFTISTVIAIGVGIFGASRVVIGLRMSLDAIFDVPVRRGGLLARLVAALIALVLLMGAVALAIGLTVVPTILGLLDLGSRGVTLTTWIGAMVLIAVGLWLSYRFGPHGGIAISWRAPGIWFATGWIIVVTGFLSSYVSLSATVSATIGVLGAPIVVLLWVYLVGLGVLVGASIIAAGRTITGTSEADQSPVR